jgi:hypothetical protein
MLVGDAFSRPPITFVNIAFRSWLQSFDYKEEDYVGGDASSRLLMAIPSYDLYTSDIRGVVSDIASYNERDYMCVSWPFFFCFLCDGFDH